MCLEQDCQAFFHTRVNKTFIYGTAATKLKAYISLELYAAALRNFTETDKSDLI